tara:strand:- start:278 stop:436 length:159 start_codon:yes stop_codon:yes gene_type:complete
MQNSYYEPDDGEHYMDCQIYQPNSKCNCGDLERKAKLEALQRQADDYIEEKR